MFTFINIYVRPSKVNNQSIYSIFNNIVRLYIYIYNFIKFNYKNDLFHKKIGLKKRKKYIIRIFCFDLIFFLRKLKETRKKSKGERKENKYDLQKKNI